jgi:hypothetical protein
MMLWTLDPHSAPKFSGLPVQELFRRISQGDLSFHELQSQVSQQGVLSAGDRAMMEGPGIPIENQPLAAALELNTSEDWLPYFLGHAYVRALHDRLSRVSSDFACPEHFVALMLRILNASSTMLLGQDIAWDTPEAVERVYSWIELIERAPPDRLRQVDELADNIDLLWFWRTGERSPGYRGDPENADAELAELITQVTPSGWRFYTEILSLMSFDEVARELGDPPLQTTPEEMAESVAAGLTVGTQSLNLCSGGRCYLGGWIPHGLGDRHAVAINVEDSIWWLSLDDAEVASFPCDLKEVARMSNEALQASRGSDLSQGQVAMTINCFVTSTGYGLPRLEFAVKNRYPVWLFEFVHPDDRESSVLTTIVPGPGRGVLQPVPKQTTHALHAASKEMRGWMETAFSRSLVLDRSLLLPSYSRHAPVKICTRHVSGGFACYPWHNAVPQFVGSPGLYRAASRKTLSTCTVSDDPGTVQETLWLRMLRKSSIASLSSTSTNTGYCREDNGIH